MKKLSILSIIVIFIVIIFLTSIIVFSDRENKNINSNWITATPIEVGLDPILLSRMSEVIKQNKFVNLHSVLIIRKGKLVFETYANSFTEKTKQYTASVSKSVGSILVGIAMDKGFIPSIKNGLLKKPLSKIYPDYKDKISSDLTKNNLTFHHILSMSSGIQWNEHSFPYSDSRNDWNQAQRSNDPVKFLLEKPVISKPGSTFYYNGALSIMMSELITQSTGKPAYKLAEKYLFEPLGIKDYRWLSLSSGLTDMAGGLYLRPGDMAKIGLLYLNKGKWQGQQIVSKKWVNISTRAHMINKNSPDYGYQWWCGDFYFDSKRVKTFLASGHGGQRIHIFPDLDMVVVITQKVFNNPQGGINPIALLSNYILPSAFPEKKNNNLYNPSSDELKKYTGRYRLKKDIFDCYLKNENLYLDDSRNPPLRLNFKGGTRFTSLYNKLLPIDCIFESDKEGKITGMTSSFGFRKNYTPKINKKNKKEK